MTLLHHVSLVISSRLSTSYLGDCTWAQVPATIIRILDLPQARKADYPALSSYHSNSFSDLLLSDIAIDNHVASQVTRITLKHSKTDQYRQGTHIYLGRNSYQVCPVKALICSLDRSRGRPGPLLYYLPISYSPEQYSVQHSTQYFRNLPCIPTISIPTASELVLLHQPSKQASVTLILKLWAGAEAMPTLNM